MKQNYELCLVGEKVTLVPYRPKHVPRYHEWMKDPDLLNATGSEPLSFEEEVEMQQSWRDDDDKCTFIVHSTNACTIPEGSSGFSVEANIGGMIGDVNLFLSKVDEEDEEETTPSVDRIQAEVDIMIAEAAYKQQGMGKAATSSMLLYGASSLKVERFFCKINEDNQASIRLFESLGFVQCDYAECFKQIELELVKPLEELQQLLEPMGSYRTIPCPLEEGSETIQ